MPGQMANNILRGRPGGLAAGTCTFQPIRCRDSLSGGEARARRAQLIFESVPGKILSRR